MVAVDLHSVCSVVRRRDRFLQRGRRAARGSADGIGLVTQHHMSLQDTHVTQVLVRKCSTRYIYIYLVHPVHPVAQLKVSSSFILLRLKLQFSNGA